MRLPKSFTGRSVHPRSCGEQVAQGGGVIGRCGSSPLVRGTVLVDQRGKRSGRFIPARAGNSVIAHLPPVGPAVHPRSCGEQHVGCSTWRSSVGSSPLVRGTASGQMGSAIADRFIPARAGNRPQRPPQTANLPVHPRSCGEQSGARPDEAPTGGSSPLVRGTDVQQAQEFQRGRFIPARAGNSFPRASHAGGRAVHPRSCGEQRRSSSALAA